MQCPYCGEETQAGVIQSQHELSWLPKRAKLFAAADLNPGAVVLSEFSFLRGSVVVAYHCAGCRKVVIDYEPTTKPPS